nr:probable aspartyl protease At4g16563 [Quercus suber]
MAASSLLSLMFLISTLLLASSSLFVAPNPTTFTIPLSPIFTKHQPSDAIKTLNSLASSSLTRAHHLKHPKSKPPLTKTEVFSHSYGGYSISLNFGTPPQTVSFILDTGSSAVWFPCTSQYICIDCPIDPSKIPLFIPKLSSSSKFIDCQNPNCARISSTNSLSGCQGCNCSQACPYLFQYGKGSTRGLLLSETLDFPEKLFTNFLVGCSNFSNQQPAGIAGFGRTPESLPSQLGLSKFSYCLISQRFNDTSESSDLILYRGSSSDAKTPGLSYTPFRKNPVSNDSALLEYYYVDLLKFIVGSKSVNIPYKYLVPENNANGNGGTIVDSGSTFTSMEKPIFDAVATAFEAEMGNFSRASADVGASIGLNKLNLCFKATGLKFEKIKFPELTFEFKGGAKMELPKVNYFSPVDVGNSSFVCLTIDSTPDSVGPAIVLGNTQQQNFYVEFDLKNDRFGFRKQTCNRK